MSTLRIHIGHDFFGAGNIGDDLMLAGFLEIAHRREWPLCISCCSPHNLNAMGRRFPEIQWCTAIKTERTRRIHDCDVWLGLGDSPFQSVVGTAMLDHIVEDLEICRDFGKPAFFLGVGVNDEAALKLPQTAKILKQAEHIWTRDSLSAQELSSLISDKKVTVGADLANLYLCTLRFPLERENNSLGLVIHVEEPSQVNCEEVGNTILSWSGGPIFWFCQEIRYLHFSELYHFLQLSEAIRSNVRLILPNYSEAPLNEFTSPWWKVETCLSTRYHSALIGSWAGCKIAVYPRNKKLASLANAIGCLCIDSLNSREDILFGLRKAQPVERKRLEELESLAEESCLEFFSRVEGKIPIGTHIPANRCALGSVAEIESKAYLDFMKECNNFARAYNLRQFINWSKVWEYPWLWECGLRTLDWRTTHLVDIGSELSPFPWLVATLGAKVILVEIDDQWIPKWESLREKLQVDVGWVISGSEEIPLEDNTADVVTSFSVIEHQADKIKGINEVARVLRHQGILAISFDICEPEMGMTFPEWNGRAVTLSEFEELVWLHPAFDDGMRPRWNQEDISAFLQWHRQSAPHHNYVVGAALLYKRRDLKLERPALSPVTIS